MPPHPFLSAAFTALAIAAPAYGVEDLPRPYLILFLADDVSSEDIGCYGHPHLKTPHIDRLASAGIRFTQAYLTTSSCSPSRCSIITGRYPHNTGAPELHTLLPDDQASRPRS